MHSGTTSKSRKSEPVRQSDYNVQMQPDGAEDTQPKSSGDAGEETKNWLVDVLEETFFKDAEESMEPLKAKAKLVQDNFKVC